jgi:hypothetical protein
VLGGATDGVIDEIAGLFMACKTVVELATDKEKRQVLAQVFTGEGIKQLLEGLAQEATAIAKDPEKREHFGGQSTVAVASMLLGTGLVAKVGKLEDVLETGVDTIGGLINPKVLTILRELKSTHKYAPDIRKAIEEFLQVLDPKILDKLADAPGFKKVIEEMSQNWRKFRGGKFVLEYASKAVANGKILRFEVSNLFDDIKRIYDIEIQITKDVFRKLELKNWSKFYPDTIKSQFVKDLQKMENIGDIQWIFNKAGVNTDMAGLKANVLEALKKPDGTPIEELDIIEVEQVQKIFPNLQNVDKTNKSIKLLEGLSDDNNFKTIFQIVE